MKPAKVTSIFNKKSLEDNIDTLTRMRKQKNNESIRRLQDIDNRYEAAMKKKK